MIRRILGLGYLGLIGLAIVPPIAWGRAQSNSSLSGPIIGYVFNSADGSLRPLRGAVGSATVGPPVNLGFSIKHALDLDGRRFVASTESSPNLVAIRMESGEPQILSLSVPRERYLLASAAAGGNAAAFYAPGGALSIISALKTASPRIQSVDLDVSGDGAVTHIAISDDGNLLVYAVRYEKSESLYMWAGSDAPARLIGVANSVGGIAITREGAAIVADRGASEVFAINDVRNSAVRQFWADAREGVTDPSSVAVSARNVVYVANVHSVLTLDSGGRLVRASTCNCVPSGFHAMEDSLFRLTDGVDRTMYLMDTSGVVERFVFVPPAAAR
ncbi:MAG TPA: hypothetical protein VFY29_20885 [Terriglobia bacterium]|nr:hypothetical protein [Terriglobia bacterium]